jgi:hypothetical protein
MPAESGHMCAGPCPWTIHRARTPFSTLTSCVPFEACSSASWGRPDSARHSQGKSGVETSNLLGWACQQLTLRTCSRENNVMCVCLHMTIRMTGDWQRPASSLSMGRQVVLAVLDCWQPREASVPLVRLALYTSRWNRH